MASPLSPVFSSQQTRSQIHQEFLAPFHPTLLNAVFFKSEPSLSLCL